MLEREFQAANASIVTVYTSASPLSHPLVLIREIVLETLRHRELIWILFQRDLKAQFRQSLLGYVWLIIPPLATALVWFLMHSQQLVQFDTTVPAGVFVLIGTTLWAAFSAAMNAPSDVIFQNREVLVKLNVPAEAFILAGAARACFNLMVTCCVLFPLLWWNGFGLGGRALLFFPATSLVLILAFALGMCLAPVAAIYSDFKSIITPILSLLMFTAPVVFPIPDSSGTWATVMRWSPLTPGIEVCRSTLTGGGFEWLGMALVWLGVSLLLLFSTFVGLRVARPHIIARMGM